jgi:hypothetical protein
MVFLHLGNVDIGQVFEIDEGNCGLVGANEEDRVVQATSDSLEGQFKLSLILIFRLNPPKLDEIIKPQSHHEAILIQPVDTTDRCVMSAQ